MAHCYLRIEKIKDFGKMSLAYNHNYRVSKVTNADCTLRNANEELVKLPPNSNGQTTTYKDAFRARLQSLDYHKTHKLRRDSVLAYDILLTFSRDARDHMDIDKWKEDNVKWLQDTFNRDKEKFGDNVLSVVCHADECGNYHCHAFVIPVDERGHICASSFTDGPTAMRKLQDSYAKAMESHGLERGVKGSSAKHQDIKKFYTKLNEKMEIPMPELGETAENFRTRILEFLQEERAAGLRELYQKESDMLRKYDLMRNSIMNAAMNIANTESVEKKEELFELDKIINAKKVTIKEAEDRYFEAVKAYDNVSVDYYQLLDEAHEIAENIQKLGNIKKIMTDYNRKQELLEFARQEMPELAARLDRDFEMLEQCYEDRQFETDLER